MKIFYAVQATGNGHISRAMELLPYLQQYGHVDIFLSGNNSTLPLDAPIKYRSEGLSLYYTCNGGLDYWKILKHSNPLLLKKEIHALPVDKYDLVINDFDYITAKACALKKVKSINFGHHASFQSDHTPRPEHKHVMGEWMLKKFVPADDYLGLHFKPYDSFIVTPVIKKQILEAESVNKGHITVYLPSYCEPELVDIFAPFRDCRFEIFSRQARHRKEIGNIIFLPVSKAGFNESLIHCDSIITGGGFETPSEAIHLGKKLMAIPIRGQYEQKCNTAALKALGVLTLDDIDEDFPAHFENWRNNYSAVQIDYSQSIPRCMERLFNVSSSN